MYNNQNVQNQNDSSYNYNLQNALHTASTDQVDNSQYTERNDLEPSFSSDIPTGFQNNFSNVSRVANNPGQWYNQNNSVTNQGMDFVTQSSWSAQATCLPYTQTTDRNDSLLCNVTDNLSASSSRAMYFEHSDQSNKLVNESNVNSFPQPSQLQNITLDDFLPRRKFTADQHKLLEEAYGTNKYLPSDKENVRLQELIANTKLEYSQIRVWFGKRRWKDRTNGIKIDDPKGYSIPPRQSRKFHRCTNGCNCAKSILMKSAKDSNTKCCPNEERHQSPIDPHMTNELEIVYAQSKCLNRRQIKALSARLGLDEFTIERWFTFRRQNEIKNRIRLNEINLKKQLPSYGQNSIAAKMSENSSEASTFNWQNDEHEQPQTPTMYQFKNVGPSSTNMNSHFNIYDKATDEDLNLSGNQSVNFNNEEKETSNNSAQKH